MTSQNARKQSLSDEDVAERVRLAVEAAHDRQAVDLKVLDLAGVSDFTDYFLICSGNSDRQVQAIADAVDAKLRAGEVRPLHQEGMNGGNWVLLDYGDFIVHVFRDETRRFYALERLWGDAPEVTDRFRP
jgi:ribosome-associated protein